LKSLQESLFLGVYANRLRAYEFATLGWLVWISCYIVGSSYDYRLVFASGAFFFLARIFLFSKKDMVPQRRLAFVLFCGFSLYILLPLLPAMLFPASMDIGGNAVLACKLLSNFCDLFVLPFVAGALTVLLVNPNFLLSFGESTGDLRTAS
jgi:hypothetical protein